ncbi:MAG: hypothetical protein ABIR47_14600 [Candidatus Kapaibacterium sp.]
MQIDSLKRVFDTTGTAWWIIQSTIAGAAAVWGLFPAAYRIFVLATVLNLLATSVRVIARRERPDRHEIAVALMRRFAPLLVVWGARILEMGAAANLPGVPIHTPVATAVAAAFGVDQLRQMIINLARAGVRMPAIVLTLLRAPEAARPGVGKE